MPLERYKAKESTDPAVTLEDMEMQIDRYQDLTLEVLKSCLEFISPHATRACQALEQLAEQAGIKTEYKTFFIYTDEHKVDHYTQKLVIKDRTL